MFCLRNSALSSIRIQLLQSLSSINGAGGGARLISVKAGMEIPDGKRLEFALPYIHGIGRARARQILSELNMDNNKLAKDLTKREIFLLGEELSNFVIGKELRNCVERDMKRMVEIQCYKGIRHKDGLPSRGQRTRTNARTKKSSSPMSLALRKN